MFATCHPDRKASAKGLCNSCYKQQRRADPEVVERIRQGQRNWYHQNIAKARASTAETRLKRRYGLSSEMLEAITQAQKGTCAICHRPGKRLNVDHCHKSGKVRGLLCHRCNTAITYLENHLPEMWRYLAKPWLSLDEIEGAYQ
jgi:hypothetical protein